MHSKQKWLFIGILSILLGINGHLYAFDNQLYTYSVRPGDTLSEITLMFTGNLNYFKVAKLNNIINPDLIYPGNKISLNTYRPITTLREYLTSIYGNKLNIAYKLLSRDTREKFSYSEFKRSTNGVTYYDLSSLKVCSDFYLNNRHILQINAQLEEDPASWGFSLVREKYKWYILLFELDPTAPKDDDFITWKCN